MSATQSKSGFVRINNAKLYYEISGTGLPVVLIHAGVADSRQWNNEFTYFSQYYRVIRYDMRGHGKSEPVEGEFSNLADLVSLLDAVGIYSPVVLIGCSMGGSLAIDFALTHPTRVIALITLGAGPSGLDLGIPLPPKYVDAEKAFEAGDLDLTAEIETQIWFDGIGRSSDQVNQTMRQLLFDMDRLVLSHEVKELGSQLTNTDTPAVERLNNLDLPVLIIVGEHDTPYMLAAAEYMEEKITLSTKITIEDAAHLANMDHPHLFQGVINDFLLKLSN
jgi:pimeloyl-ACP methyl ester carboxylesterase